MTRPRPTPIPCGPPGTFDHGLDYDVIDEPEPAEESDDLTDHLDTEMIAHMPAVLAVGRRIEETVLADMAAHLDCADLARRVEGVLS